MGQSRRTFTDEFKAAAVGRLYEPGATQTGVAKELGVTSSQLKTWRLEDYGETSSEKALVSRVYTRSFDLADDSVTKQTTHSEFVKIFFTGHC
ncbi:MAG: transposase [Cognatishimia sp.]